MTIYDKITEIQNKNIPCVIVTVVAKDGHGPQLPGAKMLVGKEGRLFGTIGGGSIEALAEKEAISIININEQAKLQIYKLGENDVVLNSIETGMICGGTLTLFFEPCFSKDTIYIFGAGHIGQALSYHLRELNFNIVICDCRDEYKLSNQNGHCLIIDDYSKILASLNVPEHSYFIIVTHSHELDYTVLKRIYTSNWNPKYVGAIASKKKSQIIINRLKEDGLINNIDINKLYCPIGLKTGGSSPDEIAISIVAEILTIKYEKFDNNHCRLNV